MPDTIGPRYLSNLFDKSLTRLLLLSLVTLGLVQGTDARAEGEVESHPGISYEADYSEAVFAFNNKNYNQTLSVLASLLKKSPSHIQALELQALTLKSTGREEQSLEAYRKLVRLKPAAERGPYHFELGLLYFRKKNLPETRANLLRAIELKFNTGVAHFFLGTAEFQSGDKRRAEYHFTQALVETPDELKVASHYYLGVLNLQSGYTPGATHELLLARDTARKYPDNPTAQDISAAAVKALAPFDRSNWFGNISVVSQYDGNVSQVSPNVAPEQATGKQTARANLAIGVGRVSSPLDWIQWAASYRLSYNKNFNPDASDYEFATNVASLYLTLDPLALTNYGLKVEGNFGFQNHTDDVSQAKAFRPYSLSVEPGVYIRQELARGMQLSGEFNIRPQQFYFDATGTPAERTGIAYTPRILLHYETGSTFWNPSAAASYEINNANGTDLLSRTVSLDLSNTLRLPGRSSLTFSLDAGYSRYPKRAADRTDILLGGRVSFVKDFGNRFSLVSDVGYTANSSTTPDVYSYTKPVVSLGLSYTL